MVDLAIHMAKYSSFGMSFRKGFLAAHGANPVYYIAQDSQVFGCAIDINVMPPVITETSTSRVAEFDKQTAVWHSVIMPILFKNLPSQEIHDFIMFVTRQFLGHLKFFDHTLADDNPDNYYMEREWRVIGHVDFRLADVCSVILPQEYAKRFRQGLPDYEGELLFATPLA